MVQLTGIEQQKKQKNTKIQNWITQNRLADQLKNQNSKMKKYFNKVPPFKPDPEHYTRKQRSWKAKEAYENEDDAWEFLQENPKLKAQGYTVYRCRTCSKWHVGHKDNKNI